MIDNETSPSLKRSFSSTLFSYLKKQFSKPSSPLSDDLSSANTTHTSKENTSIIDQKNLLNTQDNSLISDHDLVETEHSKKKLKKNDGSSSAINNKSNISAIILYHDQNKLSQNRPPLLPILPLQRLRIFRAKQLMKYNNGRLICEYIENSKQSTPINELSTTPVMDKQVEKINSKSKKKNTKFWSGDFEYDIDKFKSDLIDKDSNKVESISNNIPIKLKAPSLSSSEPIMKDVKTIPLSQHNKDLLMDGKINNHPKKISLSKVNDTINKEDINSSKKSVKFDINDKKSDDTNEDKKSDNSLKLNVHPTIGFDFLNHNDTPSKNHPNKKKDVSSTTTSTKAPASSTGLFNFTKPDSTNNTNGFSLDVSKNTKKINRLDETDKKEQEQEEDEPNKKRKKPILTSLDEESKTSISFFPSSNSNKTTEDSTQPSKPIFQFNNKPTINNANEKSGKELPSLSKPSFNFTNIKENDSDVQTPEKSTFNFNINPTKTSLETPGTKSPENDNKPETSKFAFNLTNPLLSKPSAEANKTSFPLAKPISLTSNEADKPEATKPAMSFNFKPKGDNPLLNFSKPNAEKSSFNFAKKGGLEENPLSNTSSTTSTAKPAFNFPTTTLDKPLIGSTKESEKPVFSFNNKDSANATLISNSETIATKPTFNFNKVPTSNSTIDNTSAATTESKSAFNFDIKPSNNESSKDSTTANPVKSTFNFNNNTSGPTLDKPSFAFNKPSVANPSIGSNNESKPSFLNAFSKDGDKNKDTNGSDSKPSAFNFTNMTSSNNAGPSAFNFGPKKENANETKSLGISLDSKEKTSNSTNSSTSIFGLNNNDSTKTPFSFNNTTDTTSKIGVSLSTDASAIGTSKPTFGPTTNNNGQGTGFTGNNAFSLNGTSLNGNKTLQDSSSKTSNGFSFGPNKGQATSNQTPSSGFNFANNTTTANAQNNSGFNINSTMNNTSNLFNKQDNKPPFGGNNNDSNNNKLPFNQNSSFNNTPSSNTFQLTGTSTTTTNNAPQNGGFAFKRNPNTPLQTGFANSNMNNGNSSNGLTNSVFNTSFNTNNNNNNNGMMINNNSGNTGNGFQQNNGFNNNNSGFGNQPSNTFNFNNNNNGMINNDNGLGSSFNQTNHTNPTMRFNPTMDVKFSNFNTQQSVDPSSIFGNSTNANQTTAPVTMFSNTDSQTQMPNNNSGDNGAMANHHGRVLARMRRKR